MLDYGFNFMNTKIYIDNESTICIVKNPVYHSKTKHIAIRHHFIRDAYEKKLIQVLKIHTDDNVTDLLTKAFDVNRGLIVFRESLKRFTDGTEALLIPTLFILWLDKVSTDSAKLVPLGKVCTAIETLKKNTAKGTNTMAVLDSCPKHNMVAYLEKSEGNAEFHEIIDFLKRSSIHHALTVSPVVSTTFVEQFWTSAKSKIINNVRHITAKVAGKSVSISEASIRSDLLFDDADGIDSLPNQAIFDAIQLMGSKSTSWDQIPTNIATAVICLTSNQKYNFSKLIFDDKQLANVSVPLDHFPVNTLTSKVFSFMVKKGKHFSGKVTPLFATMLVQPTQDEDYAAANLDRKSTTGGCQFLERRLISWQCKKQTIMATSTTEIVDFLRRSKLRYALTHNPPIYDSLVKQFWQTATARTLADGTQQLNATIDSIEYTITEESVRRQLQLADASGINMLQNEEIFEGLQNIGSKSGGWDQFGSNIATALICLSTGRDFNFSKLIFDGMISNLKSKSKFLMYPRFLQMILNVQTENKNLFVPVLLTKKIFGNMKRSFQGIHRPLLPAMLTIDAGQPQPSAVPTSSQPVPTPSPTHVQITPPPISQPPSTLTHPVQSTSPPPQPSSAQPTSSPHPIQPVQTTSPPPITTIPDIQPTLPPSPQIPSPSYHDTEGPSFEPSYHMSPPPSHEPENQTSRPSEESEQLRNLMDIVPRLESRVESLEKELSETKQTLGTAILQLIEKVKKLENKLRKKRKSKETKDAQGQDQEVPSQTDQGNTFATPEKSKGSGEAQEEQISPSTLEA
ncbi:hypothetical protein Tco_0201699, partial [Tanacetum coccineum]